MRHARPDYERFQDPALQSPELFPGVTAIPDDEPVFLIRAKDVVSGDVVRAWAMMAAKVGANMDIVMAAMEQAKKMDEWKQKQVPDMPSGG